ncbi:hypothetical protein [Janthinobacterium sp. UMAB-56]|uniref:hypothetical protein n=1 Tax=Janthinobacterium sp. UMAB-56 TaxID=1365361 RepID=UPI001C58995D|nr:hypothetical protein [Janthinobacterium sp. UMAB-56]
MAKTNTSTNTPEQTAGSIVKARVLVSCAYGEPNDIIELEEQLAAPLGAVIDTDPAAVAYAESIQKA